MLDALKQRLVEIETAQRAIPQAAIDIANVLRKAVSQRRRAASKRRATARASFKGLGYSGAAIRKLVAMPKRGSSGVPLRVVPNGDEVRVSASTQVHHFARVQDERAEWMDRFRDRIVRAAKGVA